MIPVEEDPEIEDISTQQQPLATPHGHAHSPPRKKEGRDHMHVDLEPVTDIPGLVTTPEVLFNVMKWVVQSLDWTHL